MAIPFLTYSGETHLTKGAAGPGIPSFSLNYNDSGGYLEDDMPDMLSILPPPPETGSYEWELDQELSQVYLGVPEERKQLAVKDAILQFPEAADAFNMLPGIQVNPEQTPALFHILKRTCIDGGRSTGKAKRHYQRPRPFMINQQPTLTPWDEDMLLQDGSYPSGHTAIGWIWALILKDLFPAQSNEIITRGYHFGVSRNICNVHWYSDVVAGRMCGNAVTEQLYASAEFRRDLARAREEIRVPGLVS